MKYKKAITSFVILLSVFLVTLITVTNEVNNSKNENNNLKKENTQLKDKITELEKSLEEVKSKEDTDSKALAIDYVETDGKLIFIEKENYILALPQSDSQILRPIYTNTLATVYQKAIVNSESWLFIQIPTYDSNTNNRGWIKEAETIAYTDDKRTLVQSNVDIKAGSQVYETEKFSDINTLTPTTLSVKDSGRLQEKKDGYCRISIAGGKDIWVKETSIVYPETK